MKMHAANSELSGKSVTATDLLGTCQAPHTETGDVSLSLIVPEECRTPYSKGIIGMTESGADAFIGNAQFDEVVLIYSAVAPITEAELLPSFASGVEISHAKNKESGFCDSPLLPEGKDKSFKQRHALNPSELQVGMRCGGRQGKPKRVKRVYSQEFRDRARALFDKRDVPTTQIAKMLKVPVGTIYSWKLKNDAGKF